MGKENSVSGSTILFPGRPVTRALASAMRASSKLITSSEVVATIQNQGRVLRTKTKRAVLDEKKANAASKKRTVLKDVTNLTSCVNVAVDNVKQIKKGKTTSSKVASSTATSQVTDAKVEVVSNSAGGSLSGCTGTSEASNSFIAKESSMLPPRPPGRSNSIVETSCVGASSTEPSSSKFVDIDSDGKDPLLCSLYAPDIYHNLRVAELKRRPYPDFMESIQKDVTQTMRRILVDWLVEVSEEYTLVPDTLYLTVYLIDWFLRGNYMERQRLQLLGITCMLIASKYEEICAPRIEEFCFITDNTYTRDQVLEMESQVLKHMSFQIYSPTSITFLRRFVRAAQASYLIPSMEMQFLANYLTELTLIEYHFLKFLPSIIAASAVFLAKWTLNQSNHPWNSTLEHYTTYKASNLRECVHALQDLQLNTKGCPLNSIRLKYRQEKFKSVAVYTCPKLPDKLFSERRD